MRKLATLKIFILFSLIFATLASSTAPIQASPNQLADLHRYPIIPAIRGSVYSQSRYLVSVGKRLGNRVDVFSKIGDSITQWDFFLTPIGNGGLRIAEHPELQPTVDRFVQTMARTNNSFSNVSLAASGGWIAADLLDPGHADPGVCQPGETPVACELRINRPAVALIMVGTNDLLYGDLKSFQNNLNQIVNITKKFGVIPVLSTIPYRFDDQAALNRVGLYNDVIVRVAQAHSAPLWNYWLAMESLSSNGISTDGVHPSVPPDGNTAIFDGMHLGYGFTMRNLTAVQVLNSLLPILR
jgi:hypothetical protein